MRNQSRICRPLWSAAVLAALLMTGCGGSSDEGNSYPTLFRQYGGAGSYPSSSLNPATFDQEFRMSDGETWKNECTGIIRILNQEGATWTGRVERGVQPWGIVQRCYSSGDMAGEVGMDSSIRFTLTQQRWGSMNHNISREQIIECAATGPGQYTGYLERNRFYAIGTTPLACADGREGTVREIWQGAYPAPDGSHDT